MKYYVATRFRNRQKAKDFVEKMGPGCTANWIFKEESKTPTIEDLKGYAQADLDDIDAADCPYLLSEDCEAVPGGMWFEAGYALAKGKRCFLIGPAHNIFCHLMEKI